jgi:cobalamin biosynthesis Co2+ chelatase CbiK
MANGEQKYRVIFMGAAVKDFGMVDKLVNNLQNHCHISAQAVTKMMRLAPITVKNEVGLQEAERYKRALEGMGAKVVIEPIDGVGAKTAKADMGEGKQL